MFIPLFVTSCVLRDSAREAVPQQKFVDMYCALLQEAIQENKLNTDRTTTLRRSDAILAEAGITREQYLETLHWHNADVERWKAFMEAVVRRYEEGAGRPPVRPDS